MELIMGLIQSLNVIAYIVDKDLVQAFSAQENDNDSFPHSVQPASKTHLAWRWYQFYLIFPVVSQGLQPTTIWQLSGGNRSEGVSTASIWSLNMMRESSLLVDVPDDAGSEMNEWSRQWDFHLSGVRQNDERGGRLGELQWFKVGSKRHEFTSALAALCVHKHAGCVYVCVNVCACVCACVYLCA